MQPDKIRHVLVVIVAVCWSIFQLYAGWDVTIDAMVLRASHVAFALSLAFLLNPSFKNRPWASLFIDGFLVALGAGVGLHVVLNFERLVQRIISVSPMTTGDLFFGAVAVPLILEATRRTVRAALAIVAACFCIYALTGPYLPGGFKHAAAGLRQWIEYLYLTTDGIFGFPAGVSATFVFLFLLFVAFLQRTQVGQFYLDVALAMTGRTRGGAAKASVVASSFFGTISGSAVANTVGTGSFTIPLMIRSGLKPYFAAAVEALSSTGGQIMPPVMGAAAFVMAELTGISYWDICKSAAFPALLFYASVFIMIHLQAVKTGLEPLRDDEVPHLGKTLKKGGHLILPVVVLMTFLALDYTVTKAALMSIVATLFVHLLDRRTPDFFREIAGATTRGGAFSGVVALGRGLFHIFVWLGKTLDNGARMALDVAIACICAGIIVGVITLSGLGLRFSGMITVFSGEALIIALIVVAMASIILGMGMSTTADYITVSTLAVPALYMLKVETLSAHMFALYFACLSMITPPVALAAYAAAGIAQTGPWRVGFTAMRLGIVAILIPFLFAYNPALLLIGSLSDILLACFTSCIGIVAIAGASIGFLFRTTTVVERILLLASGLALIKPGLLTDLIGLPIFALVLAWNYYAARKEKSSSAAQPRESA